MHVLLTAGESVTFSAEGYAFSLAGYDYDPDELQAVTVTLDALPRTVFFKVRSDEGEVSYTVNGGTPVTGALEDGMLVIKDVKNGDEIVLTVDGKALPAIVVSHRNASGIYEVSPPSDLVRRDAYWLAVPAVLFLIIAIFVVLHDYRRRR